MDGNGRWARERKHRRPWGHIRGASVASQIVEEAKQCGVEALTLYAFSSENWARPLGEVTFLFTLLRKYLLKEKVHLLRNRVRFKVIGNISPLPRETQEIIEELEGLTKGMKGLKLTFAFSYGGRDEIVWAANRFRRENPGRELTVSGLSRSLMLPDLGDVDLLIRTGGEQRLSNFLLWQSAYAELYFTPTKWPDFTPKEFSSICRKVAKRERRFGAAEPKNRVEEAMALAEQNRECFIHDTTLP